jgi:hypothetical protein
VYFLVKSFVEQSKDDIKNLKTTIHRLLQISSIRESKKCEDSILVIISPSYHWENLSPEGETIQTNAKEFFEELVNRFDLIFNGKPKKIVDRYHKAKDYLDLLINREDVWNVPLSVDIAEKRLREQVEKLQTLFEWLKTLGDEENIFVPDTNALIINHKLETYGKLVDIDLNNWVVVITPTVLRELDELKIKNTNSEFKEKVKKTINYLKGLRNQGDILKGVTLFNNTTKVKLIAVEPNMNKTLWWLDSDNNDDRIIASCFELQINNPASCVILITADLNLQTKASMARLPFIEPKVEVS